MHHRSDSDRSRTDRRTRRRSWWGRFAPPGAPAITASDDDAPTSPSSPSVADEARVDCVVDPDGVVLLFRIVGVATLASVELIDQRTASLDARHTVHLDLHDATIPTVHVVRELERLADRLEQAMVRVRMVGVDPDTPALDPRR